MAEIIRICCEDKLCIGDVTLEKKEFLPLCELEKLIPKDAYVCQIDENTRLFAVKSEIGKEPHPFILMCEAARYVSGVWIVGIDIKQNRYFTPIFTN